MPGQLSGLSGFAAAAHIALQDTSPDADCCSPCHQQMVAADSSYKPSCGLGKAAATLPKQKLRVAPASGMSQAPAMCAADCLIGCLPRLCSPPLCASPTDGSASISSSMESSAMGRSRSALCGCGGVLPAGRRERVRDAFELQAPGWCNAYQVGYRCFPREIG